MTSSRFGRTAGNGGAALVFAVFAVATLVSIALFASATARGMSERVKSRVGRAALRDAAEAALVETLWKIEADTNAVDCLSEPWAVESAEAAKAIESGADGVFTVVSDERARLGFPDCGEKTFAALLSVVSGLDAAAAAGLSKTAFEAFGSGGRGGETAGFPLPLQPESLLVPAFPLPAESREALAAALPFVSAVAGPAFNANTATREVVVAAALGGGATPGGAEGLWLRLEMARARGDEFASVSPSEALKLLRGEGDVPTPEEMEALTAVHPRLRADSGLFRVRSVARRGALSASVECIWERGTGRILRWVER